MARGSFMKTHNSTSVRGFTASEALVAMAILTVVVVMIYAISPSRPRQAKLQNESLVPEILPPNTNPSDAPIPVLIEHHLGREWVIARGKTNWPLVVYYPGPIMIKSIRKVTVDLMGNVVAPPPANNIGSPDSFQAYEVTASIPRGQISIGPATNFHIDVATECFTIQPNVLHVGTIFICVSDSTLEFLKSKLPKKE